MFLTISVRYMQGRIEGGIRTILINTNHIVAITTEAIYLSHEIDGISEMPLYRFENSDMRTAIEKASLSTEGVLICRQQGRWWEHDPDHSIRPEG